MMIIAVHTAVCAIPISIIHISHIILIILTILVIIILFIRCSLDGSKRNSLLNSEVEVVGRRVLVIIVMMVVGGCGNRRGEGNGNGSIVVAVAVGCVGSAEESKSTTPAAMCQR